MDKVKNVKMIGASVKRVFNLGNYESLALEAWVEIEVEDGDVENARNQARAEITATIQDLYEEHYESTKKR